jgi:EmrB/QacA subfamily drug resistance transporter
LDLKYKWTVLTVTTVAVLMAGIDTRIVIVGLPQIAAALGADAEQAIWFTQAYTLGSTVILLLIGRLSDIFGRVKIYTYGFAIFTIGSALISLSNTPSMVILFRFVQGFGSGIIFTNSVALIVDATPPKELGFTLGLNMSSFRFGAMAGLTLSGLILSILDWRALFYINVPIGIFGTFWARRRLREMAQVDKTSPMDWVGFATFTVFITSLLLGLTFAAYGMTELTTAYGLIALGIASLVIFVYFENRAVHPLFDLKILRIREYSGGVIAQLLNAAAWGAVLLLASLYLQLIAGLDPFNAGLMLVPFELSVLATGALSGKLADRFGNIYFTTSGLAVTSISLLLLSTVGVGTPYHNAVFYLVLFGMGTGLFASPNVSSTMGAVPEGRRGVASAFRVLTFNVGLTVSLNLAILFITFTVPYAELTQMITSLNAVFVTEADRVAFMQGLQSTYLWLAAINSAAILPSILRGKRKHETDKTAYAEATHS